MHGMPRSFQGAPQLLVKQTEQSRGCSQILLWHWGARGCLCPHAGGTGVMPGGRWGAGSVPVPHPSWCSWELVSALQMGCFPRAALMGTNWSPQPGSSRQWTSSGVYFPVGTCTSFSSGTVGGIWQEEWCCWASERVQESWRGWYAGFASPALE